jgi:transcriptional regulator with XRE-family HTH domain
MSIGKLIQELRKEKGFSQTDLTEKVGISYPQISRYETKEAQPPAEVLSKLRQTLNNSVDFIIQCNAHEKATATLNNAKLISYFKEVEKIPDEEKGTVLKVLAVLIHEYITQQVFAL